MRRKRFTSGRPFSLSPGHICTSIYLGGLTSPQKSQVQWQLIQLGNHYTSVKTVKTVKMHTTHPTQETDANEGNRDNFSILTVCCHNLMQIISLVSHPREGPSPCDHPNYPRIPKPSGLLLLAPIAVDGAGILETTLGFHGATTRPHI